MNTAQWPQEIVVKPIDEIVTNTCFKPTPPPMTSTGSGGAAAAAAAAVERKTRPEKEQALNCPRCNSTNTKFCYYNNYSLTQPRYFCKTCRRYWTEGGSLRNIPVGGGSRKNKRSSSSSSSNKHLFVSSSPNQQPPFLNSGLNPKIINTHEAKGLNLGFSGNAHEAKGLNLGFSQEIGNAHEVKDLNLGFSQEIGHAHEAKDLNLGFPQEIGNAHEVKDLNLTFAQGFGNGHNSVSEFLQMSSSSSSSSALEHLGISSSSSSVSSCSTFMALPLPLPTAQDPSVYTATVSGFGVNYPQMQEFMRPAAMGVSVDPQEDSGNATTSTSGKLLFPFKNLNSEIDHHNEGNAEEHEKDEHSGGFWTAMLSGASAASWQL